MGVKTRCGRTANDRGDNRGESRSIGTAAPALPSLAAVRHRVRTALQYQGIVDTDFDKYRAAFGRPDDNRMPVGMYRNQCWFPYPGNNVLLCLGIHGRMIYVNRAAGLVAARLSSWPLPKDATKLFPTIAAFDEIAAQLS